VLAATTAFGKTVVAARLIAERRVNTLVLVHRQQPLDQWVDRLSTFLGVPRTAIGRIGGGKRKANGLLDVALIQSLVRKGVAGLRSLPSQASSGQASPKMWRRISTRSWMQSSERSRMNAEGRADGAVPVRGSDEFT
jgi:hypothetical protein